MRFRVEGLSLIEVLIALTVFSFGIGALFLSQTSSLRAATQANWIKAAAAASEAEIEFRRSTALRTVSEVECVVANEAGFNCTASVDLCEVDGTGNVICHADVTGPPTIFRITVDGFGPGGETFTQQQYVFDAFRAIAGGGATVVVPPDGGSQPGTGDDVGEPVDEPSPPEQQCVNGVFDNNGVCCPTGDLGTTGQDRGVCCLNGLNARNGKCI